MNLWTFLFGLSKKQLWKLYDEVVRDAARQQQQYIAAIDKAWEDLQAAREENRKLRQELEQLQSQN